MYIVNEPTEITALIVGPPNLMRANQMSNLIRQYSSKLDTEYIRTISFIGLDVDQNGRYLKKNFQEDVEQLIAFAESQGVSTIGVTNPKFWQFATGDKKLMANIGKALDGIGLLKGYTIVPMLNHFVLLGKPELQPLVDKSAEALNKVLRGECFKSNNEDVLGQIEKHLVVDEHTARVVLDRLLDEPVLAMDIETTGLLMGKDTIISIAIAPSTSEGYAFATNEKYSEEYQGIRDALKDFFLTYKNKQLWHNAMFDIPFIMRDILNIPFTDQKLINKTINSFDIEDTLHIVYLCKNSTSRQEYGLKSLMYEKYGEYDNNIDQSKLIEYSFEDVGTYNIYDVTGTMEVYNEYYPKLTEEEQKDIFESYYKPSLKTLLKVKYRGLSVDLNKVKEVKAELEQLIKEDTAKIKEHRHVKDVEYNLNANAMYKYNQTHKKQKVIEDFDLKFNPGSTNQKAILLFDIMGLPIIEITEKGNPATGKGVIEQLIKTVNGEDAELLQLLLDISDASKITNTFLKAFEELSIEAEDGSWRLHGNFKMHGTVSGRLSSTDPNLQNLEWWVI